MRARHCDAVGDVDRRLAGGAVCVALRARAAGCRGRRDYELSDYCFYVWSSVSFFSSERDFVSRGLSWGSYLAEILLVSRGWVIIIGVWDGRV